VKRTPWFNAQRQPPVNGDWDAFYELRCQQGAAYLWTRREIDQYACPRCKWRGLTQPVKGAK